MHGSTRLIMGHRIHSKMVRQLRIVWQAPTMRWWNASSLPTGAAYTTVFWCPHRQKSNSFKSSKRGSHAVGPLFIYWSRHVLLGTSRTARLKYAGVPLFMYSSTRERTIPTAACRRSLVPTFADKGYRVVSATDSHGRILGFLNWRCYFIFQADPQLFSWGWMNPVPDPPLLRKFGSHGNRTRASRSAARNSEH
jgi:hypothetical protein